MKFADAVQIASNIKKANGNLWLLTSYQPSILKVFLQASLIHQYTDYAPLVQTAEFDVLFQVLEKHKNENYINDHAILSLLLEDFDPSYGWRNRTGKSKTNPSFKPSSELVSLVFDWVSFRSGGGAKTIVVLPPLSWIPNPSRFPIEILDQNQLSIQKWWTKFATKLKDKGAILLNPNADSLDLKTYLDSGCPWPLDGAQSISNKITAILNYREPIKAIIIDLDNTLWPGVIEDGSALERKDRNLLLDKPYHEFGKFLTKLKNSGFFVACTSKNDLEDVKQNFNNLSPYFSLSQFSLMKINWEPKSKNIDEIINRLNILPKNCLFIDDNPAEILEVLSVFPDMQTVQVPNDLREWPTFLETLRWRCVKIDHFKEDKLRLIQRPLLQIQGNNQKAVSSTNNYLKSLNLSVLVRKDTWKELRTIDLINKTNQFNLNGRKVSSSELSLWMSDKTKWCFSTDLTDCYGSFGTIGIIWGTTYNNLVDVEGFVMSCRAFARNVEFAILHALIDKLEISNIHFNYENTGKNGQTMKFLNELGIIIDGKMTVETNSIEEILKEKINESGIRVEIK